MYSSSFYNLSNERARTAASSSPLAMYCKSVDSGLLVGLYAIISLESFELALLPSFQFAVVRCNFSVD